MPHSRPNEFEVAGVKSVSAKSKVGYSGGFVEKLVITRRLLPDRKCRYCSFRSYLNASSQVRFEHGWPFGEGHLRLGWPADLRSQSRNRHCFLHIRLGMWFLPIIAR